MTTRAELGGTVTAMRKLLMEAGMEGASGGHGNSQIEQLERERSELLAALQDCIADVQSELDAAGSDAVREHPTLRRKAKNLERYRALLTKHAR